MTRIAALTVVAAITSPAAIAAGTVRKAASSWYRGQRDTKIVWEKIVVSWSLSLSRHQMFMQLGHIIVRHSICLSAVWLRKLEETNGFAL
ncbi:hypothetical protein PHLGIDRAFT_20305 [Phlebiopsis gigantea 11061_1 CR5-6]|uniref:Secreted protein n=1 Tax=Phlebiopsis gigantea (strain 11061_1 CR5-6) TaxID=745531 RepID=A0A0C3NES6_PHLG1|nr:hypothetical protein PHLGIDRAFT_20305 [Phlebiopsis gigantea 11061_1 CR5-6]